jgi:aquaporin Z
MYRKYFAEFVGTFTLSFLVLEAVAGGAHIPLPVPVMAALVLGLFVYTIGAISGCHINPAVTVGLFTLGRTSVKDTIFYIAFQFGGAVAAIMMAKFLMVALPAPAATVFTLRLFVAEALGTALFTFGIAAVVKEKVGEVMSGVVVGGSLLLGVLVSSLGGSLGILNPAVAFALNATSFTAIWAPIIGSMVGFRVYQYLAK